MDKQMYKYFRIVKTRIGLLFCLAESAKIITVPFMIAIASFLLKHMRSTVLCKAKFYNTAMVALPSKINGLKSK